MAQALAIRIMVENGNVVKAELKGIGEEGSRSLGKINSAAKSATSGLDSLSVGSISVGTAFKTLAGGLSAYLALDMARKVVELSDAYTNLQTKLNLATGSTEAAAAAQKQLFAIAQETRTPLDDTVRTYQRLAPAFRDAGVAADQQMQIMRSLGQSMVSSGATAGEAASAMLQFAQAMGKGRLNGDELRSMMENWPALMRKLAEAFGVPVGMLTTLGEQGVITSDKIIQAIIVQRDAFEADFKKVATTFEQAQVQLRNEIEVTLGAVFKQSGATDALVQSVTSLREAIASPEFQRGATALADAFVAVIQNATTAAEKIGAVIGFVKELSGYMAFFSRVSSTTFGGLSGLVGTDNAVDQNAKKNILDIAAAFDQAREKARGYTNQVNLAAEAAKKPNLAGPASFRAAQDVGTLNNKSLSVFDTWRPIDRTARVPLETGGKEDKSAKRAIEQAENRFRKDEEVLLGLIREMHKARDERERAIQQATHSLSEYATDEQIAKARELAGAIYDQNKAYEQQEQKRKDLISVEMESLKLNREHASAAEQFMQKMQALDALRAQSRLTATPLSDDAYRAEAQAASDSAKSVSQSYQKQTEAANEHYKGLQQTANMAFQGIGAGLAEMLVEGQFELESFLKGLMKQMIASGVANLLNMVFTGSITGSAPTSLADPASRRGGGRHTGGVVGVDRPTFNRYLPEYVWYGSPRFHQGYFAPDEYPAILQRGESVLTPGQMRQVAGAGGINVEINNYSSEKVSAQQTGGGNLKITVGQMVAGAIMDRASPANRAIQGMIDKSARGR